MPADLDPSLMPADAATAGAALVVDDRLETVLRTRAAGPAGMRVQFRQLADLLGRVAPDAWAAPHDAALARLDALFHEIATAPGGHEGAAALLAGTPLGHPRLVSHFAAQAPRLALAAIRAARLAEADWLALVPRLPIHARGFLRHRRDLGPAVDALLARLGIDDFALSAPLDQVAADQPVIEPAPQPAPEDVAQPDTPPESPAPLLSASASEGIGAIVRRIEAFRRDREARPTGAASPGAPALATAADPHPRLPFADEPPAAALHPESIAIAIDALGTVVAADADWAPMLVGHRPFTAQPHAPARLDARSTRAFAARLPITAGLLMLDGALAVAGAWQCDAVPVFTRAGGAFAGYRACLRRPAATQASAPAEAETPVTQGADRLRQTLHELRTPINAIQGFAEMIQQQVFGATPHQYRSLAASIAADAARMLAGFEDLERLARLETGAAEMPAPDSGIDLAALVSRQLAQLDPVIGPREVRLRWQPPAEPVRVAAPAAELEHAMWRLLAVIASTAAPGERLAIALAAPVAGDSAPAAVRLDLPLPATLAMRDDATLFAADGARSQGGGQQAGGLGPGGMMGNGFALRLAAAELRAMGGGLRREGARLLAQLPAAVSPHALVGGDSATPAQAG
ncbi:histidine kinase dimerization/phospho-acceptor domain-containing protein [Novosphingobium capsulatum]|uniref:histidine kinase dimerization/phospho-acceptor domain-containing protein n=1 Tax=Novosphingobium capsulatum TaxID=13688 RepID=UPI00078847AF|nr:histidine kinase dimerization/phospho-acceptor domain-containing protein [Novosphingobium capsulatum]WQD94327.1 histidine kinase dimerization/phospho-acceptor domain-containing protein [Novosphingobium capsulatum]